MTGDDRRAIDQAIEEADWDRLQDLVSQLDLGFVYCLHLDRPLGRPQSPEERAEHDLPPRQSDYAPHARHYTGYTAHLENRIWLHSRGQSQVALVRAAVERGIGFTVARVWVAPQAYERRLKRRRGAPRLCPVCNPGNGRAKEWPELTPELIDIALVPF